MQDLRRREHQRDLRNVPALHRLHPQRKQGLELQMTDLANLKRAARAKARADAQLRTTILAAVAAGVSYADVARALGVSRQAVRQLVTRL